MEILFGTICYTGVVELSMIQWNPSDADTNPRRACAARVTVVGLCVCVYVCVCVSVCLSVC